MLNGHDHNGAALCWELIRRGVLTHDAMPDRVHQSLVIRYDVVQDVSDAYGYTDERKPRFMPTPRDVSNMLTVWGWLNDLRRQAGTGRRDYKLLVSRARGASWVKLAARFGTYEKRVARWRDGAVFWIYLKNQHAVEQMEK